MTFVAMSVVGRFLPGKGRIVAIILFKEMRCPYRGSPASTSRMEACKRALNTADELQDNGVLLYVMKARELGDDKVLGVARDRSE